MDFPHAPEVLPWRIRKRLHRILAELPVGGSDGLEIVCPRVSTVVVRHPHEIQSAIPVVQTTIFKAFVFEFAFVQMVSSLRLGLRLELIKSVQ